MRGLDKSPQSLAARAIAGFPPVAENGTKAALTTGMTTDRKIFDFLPHRGIMAEIEYPGIAKLVSRLVWDQETVRSSRTTRTKIPLKSADFRGVLLIPCLLRRKIYGYIVECRLKNMSKNHIISLQIFLQT